MYQNIKDKERRSDDEIEEENQNSRTKNIEFEIEFSEFYIERRSFQH